MEGASRPLSAIVLAAGQGTRMRSERPKPLHLLCGRPMVLYVLDALATIGPDRAIIVVGHSADRVTKKLSEHDGTFPIEFVEQVSQLGTGDAVSVALTAFDEDRDDDDDVLVLPGDSPLLTAATVERLVTTHRESGAACTMLSAVIEDPTGYGRIVRGKGDRVVGNVEHADATPQHIAQREVNTTIYSFPRGLLAPALRRVRPDNAQGELYLTDVIGVLHDAGYPVDALTVDDPLEAQGVNDRLQLAHAEAALRARTNDRWMRAGVTMVDPATTYLDATVRLAADVTLFPGTFLQGRTFVGEGAEIGPGAQVGPYVVLDAGTSVAPGATVAPFTHLGNA
jgi:bifunctional UDP-N-acetylglucosamine pyrophosphorylase/glucosamine-1-phosphate N-acetyltransferase